ncbi:Oxidoreductase, short chain dehydrogenase/reductase family [Pseudomonas savastanoi pv. nerii]|nr:Oxidoreductase, short chain dehydrogenase/reductase family [Pseudomonas savastanoi pv. nerii]RMU52999.1 Oxidoreductase, short chain dehydrogenase/reductase family [Pseudomonas savastanoi pv. nerii]
MPEPIQSVLVTGASSGIGKAIVTRLLEKGLQVTGLSRRAPDLQNPNFTWRECDLNDFAALDKALQQTPHIDALIHAAGFMRTAPLGDLNDADGQAMWHLHVAAASHMVNALYPRLRAGSRILMIDAGCRRTQSVRCHQSGAARHGSFLGHRTGTTRHHRQPDRPWCHRNAHVAGPRTQWHATAKTAHRPFCATG